MAEETLLLKLQLQADPKNAKTINDLVKANKELAKVIKDAPREGEEGYEDLKDTLEDAKKQYAENRAEIIKFNKELRTGVKEADATKDSLKGLSKSLKNLESEYKSLSAQERKTARGRDLQKQIIRTRKELLKAEKGLGDFRRQVGNYTRSLVSLNSGIAGVAVSVGSLKSGLGGLVSAFRNSGTAAKAFLLTLGPISAIIGTITVALSKFQSVTDAVKSNFAGLSSAFDVFAERFGRFGQAFSNLLDLDFQGFANDAKAAFSGAGEEAAREFSRAKELSEDLQAVRDREINNIVRLAELERDIATEKQTAAENEKTNRAEAIRAIERAIELTREQQKIELDLARDRAEALKELVELSTETTRVEDRKAAEEATANVIRLEKQFLDETTALIRRRETLRKKESDGNKERISELQALQKRQAELSNTIREQILAGEDYTENLKELRDITLQLTNVDETFQSLIEKNAETVDFATNSIKGYNAELEKLNQQLEKVAIGSAEYEAIQKQILQTEAQRAAALGEIQMSIDELNQAQMENLAILEDSETALRLRAEALKELQSLEGGEEERARRRAEIERQLEQDLRQLRINRIEDEQELLNEELNQVESNLNQELELYADNEQKKQELLLIAQGKRDEIRKQELELEKELLDLSKKNFDDTEKSKTASTREEERKRKELRDIAIETSIQAGQKVIELLSVIQQQQTEQQAQEIDERERALLEEAELLGKTEEEKQQIRQKFEKEREELAQRAAAEKKALAIAEATIDIAGAVIKSLNSPPPTNVALAASTAALGAIQLAIIAAANFAEGGLVMPVELESGRIVTTPNIKQMRNGDNVLATVRTGEVILNEDQQRRAGGAAFFKALGVKGFANGGKVEALKKPPAFANGGLVPRFSNSVTVARAYQSGGVATVNATKSIGDSIAAENKALADNIGQAVFKGSALGSKQGTESADITGQISRQNERDARRQENESV